MPLVELKNTRNRAILIQVAIVVGLIIFYKLALPKIQQAREASAAAQREERIMGFVHSVAVEVGGRANPSESGGETDGIPQRLRVTPQVGDVEQELGAPQQYMSDFMGGEHLTWSGTRHKLVASFTKGQMYALTLTDVKTGHGMQVYESSAQWRAF
ncbi:MAG TPA: hypothetical protein VFM21_01475 [Terriglobia bacterium]|nr:hypothetical protein [Terriglobia bacterium]